MLFNLIRVPLNTHRCDVYGDRHLNQHKSIGDEGL